MKRFARRCLTCAGLGVLLLTVSLSGHAQAAGTHRLSASFPPAVQQWKTSLYWASLRTGIPANVLGAVMLTESGGNPGASSGVAYGLMQVTAQTAQAFRCGPLFDPGRNVNCGARVLAYFVRYEQSLFLGLAAYNAGYGLSAGYPYARLVLSRVPRS